MSARAGTPRLSARSALAGRVLAGWVLAGWVLAGWVLAGGTGASVGAALGPADDGSRTLEALLAENGVRVDLERGLAAVRATVGVREELLEYLCVGDGGATHESLVFTSATPSVLNTALLALGVEPGRNAVWTPRDPPPTREERREGLSPYDVTPPEGDGFLLYLAWRHGDEVYFFRVEDLLVNLATGSRMERHRWVYLGSRFVTLEQGGEEVFAADVEQNLVNVSFFHEGHTLLTAALPQCIEQTIWMGNTFLLPPREAPLWLIFAREPLRRLPPEWESELPEAVPPEGR